MNHDFPPAPAVHGYFRDKTLAGVGAAIRSGETSCVEVMEVTLDGIASLNPMLNAFVHIDTEHALHQAREADRALAAGRDAGPLHGMPIAIKDNIDTADMPTTYGSAHFSTHQPTRDALCVARLRQAGGIVVGKTLTHEFAYGPTGDRSLQGAARNPWDVTRMTGGSSAGSAAAVAAGLVPLALGTDTGGSIRIPSGLCGTVGFKPSFGVVPLDGVFPLSSSLDHVGPIAGNVADVALLYRALLGAEGAPAETVPGLDMPPTRLRIAWIDAHAFGPIDASVAQQVARFAAQYFGDVAAEGREGRCEPVDLGHLVPRFQSALAALQRAEAYDIHAQRMRSAPALFDAEVRERLEMSADIKGWEYVAALRHRDALRAAMAALFERYDVLLMPTLPITAPLIDQRVVSIGGDPLPTRNAVLSLTSAWNVTGLPAISLPAGRVDGLPVGLQAIAAMGRDDWLLRIVAGCGATAA